MLHCNLIGQFDFVVWQVSDWIPDGPKATGTEEQRAAEVSGI